MTGNRKAGPASRITDPVTDSSEKQLNLILTPPVKKIRANTKLYRVLSALLIRDYNRFEAARELHDHVLHSTVSTIQNQHGILVDRKAEIVPGYGGEPTHVCRYWVSPSQHEKAHRLLGVIS